VKLLVTAQNIFDNAMDLMDKRNAIGIIDKNKTARYLARTPSILTIGQNILTRDGNVFNDFSFNHTIYKNLLGMNLGVTEKYVGVERIYTSSTIALAYYFNVDADAVITIEELNGTWNTLITIQAIGITDVTEYKGVLVPSPTSTQTRIRFNGSSVYNYSNVALFSEPFASSQVPVYNEWIEVIMPSDFESMSQIIKSSPIQPYQKYSDFKFQETNEFYMSWYFEGTTKILYTPSSAPIVSMTDVLNIDDITAYTTLTYYLATHLLLLEDAATSSYFNQMYMEGRNAASKPQPSPIEPIEDVLGGGWD
jgi:hypothetical protein